MTPSTGDRIVVAVDFGTTFSGYAITISQLFSSICCAEVCTAWLSPTAAVQKLLTKSPSSRRKLQPQPFIFITDFIHYSWSGGGPTSDKVPSQLAYVKDPACELKMESLDIDGFDVIPSPSTAPSSKPKRISDTTIQWGYQLKQGQPRLHYLKLLLDPRQELPEYIARADLVKQLQQCGKTATEAVADYLSLILKEAENALRIRFGEQMLSTTKIEYVLTVPAVWSDAAKDATIKAAEKAGLGSSLHMISEPEAAAIYALKTMEHNILSEGDIFIVCDAGGGTVDLISYEIMSLHPLQLQECVPGCGSVCGSALLNMRFENFVKARMGHAQFAGLCKQSPMSWEMALRFFEEHVKREFNPSNGYYEHDDTEFFIPLSGVQDDASKGIKFGFLKMCSADLVELFRPLIDRVMALVEGQKRDLLTAGKVARGVILVGGFGQSRYLHATLQTRFGAIRKESSAPESNFNALGLQFSVIQPLNAWTAVVRGAVLSNIEGQKILCSRRARRHYGVHCVHGYREGVHSPENKYWDSISEDYWAHNQAEWHVRKGDAMPSSKPVLLPFNIRHDGHGVHSCYPIALLVSDDDEAPSELSRNLQTRELCKLVVNLEEVPKKHWKKRHQRKVGLTLRCRSWLVWSSRAGRFLST